MSTEVVCQSDNPLKAAIAKVKKENLEKISDLRVAKDFASIGSPFVGFEGNHGSPNYFQLRVDYDEKKKGHVNVILNRSEAFAFTGKSYDWYIDVINNMNGRSYCNVPKDSSGHWQTAGLEKDSTCIEGMK